MAAKAAPDRPRRQARGEATRARILQTAARAIRSQGPDRVGVVEIMREAGLSHGGFYAHFASKDDLVAEAIRSMFEDGRQRFLARTEGLEGIAALKRWVSSYLSPSHRDNRGGGCALAALSGDLARLDADARRAFEEGLRGIIARHASYLPPARRDSDGGGFDPEAFARSLVAQLAGALALARAVADPSGAANELSDSILQANRDALLAKLDALQVAP